MTPFRILFLILILNSILSAQTVWRNTDTTSTILLTFSEPIKPDFTINDFSIIDSATGQNYRIWYIGLPLGRENAVVLICERLRYKSTAIITAAVRDTANNLLDTLNGKFYYRFNGLKKQIQKPIVF